METFTVEIQKTFKKVLVKDKFRLYNRGHTQIVCGFNVKEFKNIYSNNLFLKFQNIESKYKLI